MRFLERFRPAWSIIIALAWCATVGATPPTTGCPARGVDAVVSPSQASAFIGGLADDGAGGVYLTETHALPAFVQKMGVLRVDHAGAPLWSVEWQRAGGTDDEAVAAVADVTGVFAIGTTFTGDLTGLAIVRYTADGTLAWEAIYQPTGRDEALSARSDGAGGVLVAGYTDDGWFLVRYGPDGARTYARRATGYILASGIGLDAAGNAYFGGTLVDDTAATVLRISPTGGLDRTFDYPAAPGQRLEGGALAVTPDGGVRLALFSAVFVQLPEDPPGLLGFHQSHVILGFAPDGSLAFTFVLDGTSETSSVDGVGGPTRAILDADGNLYVSGSLRRYGCIVPLYKISPAGALLWRRDLLSPSGNLAQASALVLDAGGVTLAAEFGGSPVFVARATPDGAVTSMLTGLSGVGGPALSVAPDGTTFAAVTLGATKHTLNKVDLLRLDAPPAPAGTFVAGKRLAFKGRFRNYLSRSLQVANKSKTACLLIDVASPADPFVAGGLLVLPPRGKGRVSVAFVPPASGTFKGVVSIDSSDPRHGVRAVKLTGRH